MQEFLAYNFNGIPLVFWGFMVALILAMHCMARASLKEQTPAIDSNEEAIAIPHPTSDVAIG
ncbi:MAG: hypothetical protein ABJN04_00820 [Hyphomicrobiales bacterium]